MTPREAWVEYYRAFEKRGHDTGAEDPGTAAERHEAMCRRQADKEYLFMIEAPRGNMQSKEGA